MERQKPWQFWLIITVIILTLYNILPTVFYYSKPLHQSIDAPRAKEVAESIITRVNSLEEQSKEWLASFSKLLGIKPLSIEMQENNPQLIKVTFANEQDAKKFKSFLPSAGNLIPFVPAQLSLNPPREDQQPTEVYVARQIGVQLNPADVDKLFHFSPMNEEGVPTPLYQQIAYDRVAQMAEAFTAPSGLAAQILGIVESPQDKVQEDWVIKSAKELVDGNRIVNGSPKLAERWFASLAEGRTIRGEALFQKYQQQLEATLTQVKTKLEALKKKQSQQIEQGDLASGQEQQSVALMENQVQALTQAIEIVKKQMPVFAKAPKPKTQAEYLQALKEGGKNLSPKNLQQVLSLGGADPLIRALVIDWNINQVSVQFYKDVVAIRDNPTMSESNAYRVEKLNQWIYDDIARVSNETRENFSSGADTFIVKLNELTDSQSFLTFDLGYVAQTKAKQILDQIATTWNPQHPDFVRSAYPINSWEHYQELPKDKQRLGLVVYAPAVYSSAPPEGFSADSIYVIAKGLGSVLQKYQDNPKAEGAEAFSADVKQLSQLLQRNGFAGFAGNSFGVDPRFKDDFIFKLSDYYGDLIKATRENFVVKGSQRYAVLDFTDVEQRILTQNRIYDRMQEDLLKWSEEYSAAQVDLDIRKHYLIPPPTQNPYWQNLKISAIKYFQGDDRKILKWGLDLSGGKTVRIGLRDSSNKPVTNPNDLKQAVNELYTRVNKMGVAERTIRIESNNIVLDFPGSQGFSASELVKASAMYFHIANEKFQPYNREIGGAVQSFLQAVWNEAVVTNRKDAESINAIAYRHLGEGNELSVQPRSEAAQILYDNGLRFANPREDRPTTAFNDTLSTIGVQRGDDLTEWHGQTNPLVIIFYNYALEGSSLSNVQVGWDQTQGNMLTFGVKNSYDTTHEGGTGSPREDFYTWTSQFSEDRIVGTPKEVYSGGHGWRMAVILNGHIITMPNLRQALRDNASITGRFTQREINQLAADLKAGSLSFTPRILSEENISPELGQEERTKGIRASLISLALVVISMVGYYRFGGLVASCAVLFNIFIMWGVLQNLDAALTLPGIAGIVLTIGMAVDANVLVFERVREEFKHSGRIASAIQAGYRKAFSAIFDSNITTIIVAVILIQFDSGPIRGFAVTLIIGILSSMFTALFMTRYFFAGWVQNPKHKQLNMAEWIKGAHFDFLAQTRKVVIASALVIALGVGLFIKERNTIFGMDFTGGYSLVVEAQEQPGDVNYRLQAIDALLAQGATINDIQVRQLTYPQQLRIQLGMSMEEKDHPFYQLPEEIPGHYTFSYLSNPRIDWVVKALQKGGLQISDAQLSTLDRHWTIMSGQFSDTMRNNAIIGIVLALLAIMAYITVRFEFKYAVSAVVGLIHDVIITLGAMALFHYLGFPIQIDLEAIGAIMMIIGYSLNDTIIVFDRIREDAVLMRKMPFRDIVNHALNITLSRTLMTSGTTLLVLLGLVLFGGEAIFGFAFIMMVGIVVGTLSSLFVASPVMLLLHNREERAERAELNHRKV